MVFPPGSGNDPCRNQAGEPPSAGPCVGGCVCAKAGKKEHKRHKKHKNSLCLLCLSCSVLILLLHDGLHYRGFEIPDHFLVGCLNHEQTDEFLFGIDPEMRPEGALPAE